MAAFSAQDIRKTLEEEIARGRLAPGMRLEEIALAQRFGVSRTPVREALRLMEPTGLVEIRPRRGAIVAAPSRQRVHEMFELMAELEAMCGRLAAERMDAAARESLTALHVRCQDAADAHDVAAYYDANMDYHSGIYAGARNSVLADEMMRQRLRLRPFRRLQLQAPHRMMESAREHDAITQAILDGDGAEAAKLLHAHLVGQGSVVETLQTDDAAGDEVEHRADGAAHKAGDCVANGAPDGSRRPCTGRRRGKTSSTRSV